MGWTWFGAMQIVPYDMTDLQRCWWISINIFARMREDPKPSKVVRQPAFTDGFVHPDAQSPGSKSHSRVKCSYKSVQ